MSFIKAFAFKTENTILKSLALLALRIILGIGFYKPAIMKWSGIEDIASWFESMDYPLPLLNAYMAAITETLGFVMLLLGLGIRFITGPLILVMLVAIFTVHFENGFEASDNGYEIALYYLLMLVTLFAFGSGKFGVDYLIKSRINTVPNT